MGRGTKSDRLKRARQMEGYSSASEAARAMGVATPTYIHHENGTRDFAEDAAVIYAARFHVNVPWLLLGEGPMYPDNAEAEKRSENRKALSRAEKGFNPLLQDQRELAAELAPTLRFVPEISPLGRTWNVPLSESWWHRKVPIDNYVVHEVLKYWGMPINFMEDIGCALGTTVVFEHRGSSLEPKCVNGDILVVNTSVNTILYDAFYMISDASLVVSIAKCRRNLGSGTVEIGGGDGVFTPQVVREEDIQIVGLVSATISRRI